MQVSQADTSKSKRVGVDEQFINFKSSPNFKVMKKFIISKIGNTETANRTSPDTNNILDPPAPPNLDIPVKIKPEVQLAADTLEASTSELKVPMKVENDEYQNVVNVEPSESLTQHEDVASDYGTDITKEPAKSPETNIMCRDFVRGTCKRPGTCKYVHKCDTSQLLGVYTFCRNYQNKICTLPNCKYVHASIFEEQEFYRTGKLPPHVLAPKLLPSTQTESRIEIPATFNNPPPPLPTSREGASAALVCHPGSHTMEARTFQNTFGGGAGAAGEAAETAPPAKKCRLCGITEVTVQIQRDGMDKRRNSIADMRKKSADLDKKIEKMTMIVTALLRAANNPPPASGTNSLLNMFNYEHNQNNPSPASGTNSLLNMFNYENNQNNPPPACGTNSLLNMLNYENNQNKPPPASATSSLLNMLNYEHNQGLLNENFGFAALVAKLLREGQPTADVARAD